MTRATILEYPDPRLRRPAEPVTAFDAELERLIDDLVETLQASKGSVGLSAPQVDDPREVLLINPSTGRSAPQIYVNPRITARAGLALSEETCLSVPGAVVKVWRSARVRVQAQDRRGLPFERELTGLEAVCLQHEIDHFAGKLIVDRMFFFRRRRFDRQLRSAAVA